MRFALRPMAPADADDLVRFHEGLSIDTTYLRFFSPHPHLSATEVDRFTHVDHLEREAVVATSAGDIIGVGRFDRLADRSVAEVAFAVADGWHRQGVGRALFEHLADRAGELGVSQFHAETLWENRAMLGLFHHVGRPVTTRPDGGVVHVEIDLRAPEALSLG
jgi:GNAT superfamily N-acetyltransferase